MAEAALSPCLAGADDSDEASFIRFVESSKTSLYAYSVAVTGNRHLAEDVLHDALIEVFKRWPTLRRERPDGNGLIRREYVFEVIRNKFRDHLRSLKRREIREEAWISDPSRPAEQTAPDEECLLDHAARELWAAVGELDPTQQSLIHLVYVEEKSLTKAGTELGLTGTTARRWHGKALERLRTLISGEE